MFFFFLSVLPYGAVVELLVPVNVVGLFVVVEAGVLTLVVIWLVVPVVLGCSVVVVGKGVTLVEVVCTKW